MNNNLDELKAQLKQYEELLAQEESSSMHYTINIHGYKAMIETLKQKIKEAEKASN